MARCRKGEANRVTARLVARVVEFARGVVEGDYRSWFLPPVVEIVTGLLVELGWYHCVGSVFCFWIRIVDVIVLRPTSLLFQVIFWLDFKVVVYLIWVLFLSWFEVQRQTDVGPPILQSIVHRSFWDRLMSESVRNRLYDCWTDNIIGNRFFPLLDAVGWTTCCPSRVYCFWWGSPGLPKTILSTKSSSSDHQLPQVPIPCCFTYSASAWCSSPA